jgi:YegS/Rv2252/BmrU family lipid kinase
MLVITHGGAGRYDSETLRRVTEILRTEGSEDVKVWDCGTQDDLERALDTRVAEGETVVAAGGDGSIHQLVATLYARKALDRHAVGLLPLGTGNDLARNLGIALEPDRAARQLLSATPRRLDLIVDEEGDVVLNAAHVGVGATAATHAARFKPYLKSAAFPIGAVLAGARSTGWRLKVEADGRVVSEDKVLMVALGNAPGIAGGAAQLAPDASPQDGRIQLLVSAATGPFARIRYALGMRHGAHKNHDDVLCAAVTSVTISGEEFLANSDGEVSGPYTRRSWRVLPQAWRIMAPA